MQLAESHRGNLWLTLFSKKGENTKSWTELNYCGAFKSKQVWASNFFNIPPLWIVIFKGVVPQLQFFCFVYGHFKVRTDVSNIKISVTLLLLSATARTSTEHLPVIHAHPVRALIRYNGFFNLHGKWVRASLSIAGSRRTLRCLHTHLRERSAFQDCLLIFKYARLFQGAQYFSSSSRFNSSCWWIFARNCKSHRGHFPRG